MAEAKEKAAKKPTVRKSAKAVVAERGMKGAMALMIQEAHKIGLENNYDGTVLVTKGPNGEIQEGQRQASMVHRLTKVNGIVDNFDEKGENYKKLYAACKAAHPDLATSEQKYTQAVKSLIDLSTTFSSPSDSKVAALKSISFK